MGKEGFEPLEKLSNNWEDTNNSNVTNACTDNLAVTDGTDGVKLLECDKDGLTICPQCRKHYKPILGGRPKGDNRLIQIIFSNAHPWEREQLVTGICSDDCWKNSERPLSKLDEGIPKKVSGTSHR